MEYSEKWSETRGTTDGVRRLKEARLVLAGKGLDGRKVHPGMFDTDVLSFSHGEGVRRPHPAVVAAGVEALMDTERSTLENYQFLMREPLFDKAIVEDFIEEGIASEIAENICMDAGTTRLFYAYLHAVASPGDVFLTPFGYYHALASWCSLQNVELWCVPTQVERDLKLTRADLKRWYERWVQTGQVRRPRGIFLFNPTYTGAVYGRQELADLASFCLEHDLHVIEDSIFMKTRFDLREPVAHLASCEGMAERVVTVTGGSKAFGLANLRIGWGCGPRAVIERMNDYTVMTLATVPHVAKAMAAAALRGPKGYLEGNARECQRRAELVITLVDRLNEIVAEEVGLEARRPIQVMFRPKSGHSILLSFNGIAGLHAPQGFVIENSIDVVRYFLIAARVSFAPGLSHGFGDCTVRATFGCMGLEHTYENTGERTKVLKLLLERWNGTGVDLSIVRDLLPGERPATYDDADNPGFRAGRHMIQEALLSRVVPALVELFRYNMCGVRA